MPSLRTLTLLLPLLLALGCSDERSRLTDESATAPVSEGASPSDPTSRYSAPNGGEGGDRDPVSLAEGTEEGRQEGPTAADTAAPTPPAGDTSAAGAPARPAVPQMIIRTGTAVVRVDSLEAAMARVERLARSLGGYIANSSVQTGSENVRQAVLEMKLPAERWSQAISGLKPIGELESQQTNSQDVGEEFVDVTARMVNARRLEARLLELLATRTGKLDDVLAVERELSRVREQIERYEGRLRFLRSRVSVSTLTVQLHEPSPVLAPGRNPIMDAFRQAWRNFVRFTAGLIASLGVLIPLGLLLAAGVWLLLRLLRRIFGPEALPWHRGNAPPAGPPAAGPPPPAGPSPAAGPTQPPRG